MIMSEGLSISNGERLEELAMDDLIIGMPGTSEFDQDVVKPTEEDMVEIMAEVVKVEEKGSCEHCLNMFLLDVGITPCVLGR